MPAPPPNGVSSTVRCRSVVQSRRSCTRRSSRPARARLADERQVERGQVLGEDRDDVDAHVSRRRPHGLLGHDQVRGVGRQQPARRVEHDAAAGDVDHRARSTVTNGTSVRAPSGSRSDEHVVRRQVLEADDLAEHPAVDVLGAQARELVRVPGVVLVGRVLVDDELGPRASPRPWCGRVISRERHVPAVRAGSRVRTTVSGPARGGLGARGPRRRRTGPRGVGPQVEGDLAAQAVGTADPRDGQLHGESSRSKWAVTAKARSPG